MVLGSDVASTGRGVVAGDVHASVTVLHLAGSGARSEGEKLVTETDTENGVLGGGDGLLDVGDSRRDERGVTRTVGEEETIKWFGLELVPVVVLR